MDSGRRNRAIIIIIIFLVIVGGWLVLSRGGGLVDFTLGDISPRILGAGPVIATDYVVPAMGDMYTNRTYGFSLQMPEGFVAAELPSDGTGSAITLQDAGGQGIQIYITPDVGDARVIRGRDVKSQIPDMEVSNEQEVEIGNDHRGVAFMSDNEAFGGKSREVWFVFKGDLYQISTYARLDPLLQAMFGTWKFE